MKKEYVYGSSSYYVEQALKEIQTGTNLDIQDEIGEITVSTINNILNSLHRAKKIHVSGWEVEGSARRKVFTYGQGKDAEYVSVKKSKVKPEPEAPFVPRPDVAAAWIRKKDEKYL